MTSRRAVDSNRLYGGTSVVGAEVVADDVVASPIQGVPRKPGRWSQRLVRGEAKFFEFRTTEYHLCRIAAALSGDMVSSFLNFVPRSTIYTARGR